jgi:hypothetical protein
MYGTFYAAGTITAPLIGSYVYEYITKSNWNMTCDIFGVLAIIYAIIYLIFNVMPDISREKKEIEEITQKVLEKPEMI